MEKKYVNIDNPSNEMCGAKPKATLINWTPNPLKTMWHVWQGMKKDDDLKIPCMQAINPSLSSVARATPLRKDLVEFFNIIVKDWTGIPEMINFTWSCENIPVALLDQMTRHRLFTFFVQSWRVIGKGKFANNGEYFVPDSIAADDFALDIYNTQMVEAQSMYSALLDQDIPIEDARGVLPMHANYKLVVHMNLRSMLGMIAKRTCFILQQQYWAPLLNSMREELVHKVDSEFASIFEPPCKFKGQCISAIEQRYRLEGKDPNEPCPIFKELWGDDTTKAKLV